MTHRLVSVLLAMTILAACSSPPAQVPSGSDATDTATRGVTTPAPQPPDTAASPAEQQTPGPDLLTADGWGPLRIGMTRAEVVAAAGEDANPNAVGGPDPETCDEFRPRSAPEGVLVMILQGRLSRISVSRNTDIATPAGLHVGDTGTAVEAAYGDDATVEPHQYQAAPARYITIWRNPSAAETDRRGIRYEIDANDRVVHVRGGGPSIGYVEGCV